VAAFPDTTREQLEALTAAAESDVSPVVMLNLLRFAGDEGRAAYGRYGEAVAPLVARVGGEVVWSGSCGDAVIGPQDGEWDWALLVRYPSRRAFLEMISSPDYGDAHPHRVAAIADSRLIPCTESSEGALA